MLFFSNLRQHNGLFSWLWLILCWIEMLWTCWGISVSFPYKKPIYIASGRTLVLHAQLEVNPQENVRLVTWDLRKGSAEQRLASVDYPDINQVLQKIDNVTTLKTGFYVVTVTDSNGDQTSASVEVRISQKPPLASLSLQCSVEPEGALWDSPVFSWWVNGTKVTRQTANMSDNGSILHLSGSLDSNYTCVINSSQGSSRVQTIQDPKAVPEPCPDPPCCSSKGTIIAVIEAIVIVLLLLILLRPYICKWYQKRCHSPGRREDADAL